MAKPAAFGLNVDPNAGGLAIAGRIEQVDDRWRIVALQLG